MGDTFNFYMIQGLRSGSEYAATINPIFGDTEGPVTTAKVKTCKWDLLWAGLVWTYDEYDPLQLCVSGEQFRPDPEGVSSERQCSPGVVEQRPRGHRLQTGLGSHSR